VTDFHNPYNFVPALPRHSVDGELGDREPVGHHAYLDHHWSGTISVKLTTITPLLISDALHPNDIDENGHKTYDLRMLGDSPYLPPTSIKGMLRAAYEAVTNSRLSVFVGHSERLAYRSPASGSNDLYPAIVGKRKNGDMVLSLLEGAGVLGRVGRLPRYRQYPRPNERDKGEKTVGLCYEGTQQLPVYRDKVWVRLNPENRFADDLPTEIRQQLPGKELLENVVTRIQLRESGSQPPGGGNWRKGWVYVTGANINGKIYERVFLEPIDTGKLPTIVINHKLESLWTELIADYQNQHTKNIEKRSQQTPPRSAQDYLGKEPGKTAYSRHVYEQKAEKLRIGSLCYVHLKDDSDLTRLSPSDVVALLPVTISRRLYDIAPEKLLDESYLHPAKSIEELSPSDRVFGWVYQHTSNTKKTGDKFSSYKGQLRVHSVKCASSNAIQTFGDQGFPLAILGQPKPQQARFYGAKNQNGQAFTDGTTKNEGYQAASQGLRGRKVYPHHKDLPENHWDNPQSDRTQQNSNGHYQEYRRPNNGGKERDDQNRSIRAWVKPGKEFTISIDVVNLSDVELGALLYLLDLPTDHYHRLGGGKPFGFGSVRLEVDKNKTDLREGQNWREFYASLLPVKFSEQSTWESTTQKFEQAIVDSYKKPFKKVPFVAAFEKASSGYSGPVHYPRVTPQPQPNGESFEWFVKNDAQPNGRMLALTDLVMDRRLPLDPQTLQNQTNRRR
jgi:CRISPR-associated protein (TIGR03986 family)